MCFQLERYYLSSNHTYWLARDKFLAMEIIYQTIKDSLSKNNRELKFLTEMYCYLCLWKGNNNSGLPSSSSPKILLIIFLLFYRL